MSEFVYVPPTENYDVNKVRELFKSEPTNIIGVKSFKTVEYLNKYFFCIKDKKDSGEIKYGKYIIDMETGEKNIIFLNNEKKFIEELPHKLKRDMNTDEFNQAKAQKITPFDLFKIQNENKKFVVDVVLDKPLVFYDNKKKEYYINRGGCSLHHDKELKKYDEYDEKIKYGVNLYIDHIKNIICDGNEEYFDFFMNWIYSVVSFKRSNIGVVLFGEQGTGKSIVVKFLEDFVIGKHLVLSTADVNCLKQFNGSFEGKTLINFEEFPTPNSEDFHNLADTLKNLITNSTIEINKKFINPYSVSNYSNIIITTNNKSIIKMPNDDRRYLMLKVSNKKRCNAEYFNELAKYINNHNGISEKVGECFYVYCREKYDPNYFENHKEAPMTDYKKELIRDGIKSEYNFILDEFFLKREDLKCSLKELYEKANCDDGVDYKSYYKEKYGDNKITIKKTFNSNLKALFEGFIKNSHNVLSINCKLDDIYNIFKNKNYLYEEEIKDYENYKNGVVKDEIFIDDDDKDNNLGLVFEPKTKEGLIKYCKELKAQNDKYEEQEEINKQIQIEKNKEVDKIKDSYKLLFEENERLKKELEELKKIKESQEKEIAELKAKAPKRGRSKKPKPQSKKLFGDIVPDIPIF